MGAAATDLTTAFREWLAPMLGADEIVVPELGILNGLVRADLAIIGTEMHGIEIKSARDTARRLPDQIAAYDEVFDRCTLVVASALQLVTEALIPEHWGIIVHHFGGFHSLRPSAPNPRLDLHSVAALLWKAESAALAVTAGCKPSIRWRRKPEIDAELVRRMSRDELRFQVRRAVAARKAALAALKEVGS